MCIRSCFTFLWMVWDTRTLVCWFILLTDNFLLFIWINCRESGAKCVFWHLIGRYAMNHKDSKRKRKMKKRKKIQRKKERGRKYINEKKIYAFCWRYFDAVLRLHSKIVLLRSKFHKEHSNHNCDNFSCRKKNQSNIMKHAVCRHEQKENGCFKSFKMNCNLTWKWSKHHI